MACPDNLGDCLSFQSGSANQAYPDAGTLVNQILPNVYIAAGIVIFFMIVLGGFTMIANASNPQKMEEGKKTITSAIMGLLVVFASYWIIQLIQVLTGLEIL